MDPSVDSAPDPKQGEREYYARIGAEGIRHALGKPFTDDVCNQKLSHVAAIFNLLEAPPSRVLEFGCGVGWLCLMLACHGHQVTGVDIAPEAIAAAEAQRDMFAVTGLQYEVGDYESFQPPEAVDAVIFYEALHHAEDEAAAIRAAFQALKPGGMLIAFEPGEGHQDTPAAQEVIARYGLHEKDMPIARIVELGRAAGFTRHLTLPEPWDFLRRVYRRSYGRATTSGAARGKFILGTLRAFRHYFFPREDQSFAVLWK